MSEDALDHEEPEDAATEGAKGERIAKALARAGVASRRDAEKLIEARRVTVNGQTLDTPAFLVHEGDAITVDGQPVKTPEPARLWRYHKPPGLVTTHKDPEGRPTVFAALPPSLPRVVSIGRLDLNSEGLILLTNDGGLAGTLEHPSTGWIRRYRVRVHGMVEQARLDTLRNGVTIEGLVYGPIAAELESQKGANAWVIVSLTEGKNREVRRVMESLGYIVNRLIRVAYGPFQLGRLERGAVEEVPRKVVMDQLAGLGKDLPAELRREKGATSGWAKAKPRANRPGVGTKSGPRSEGDRPKLAGTSRPTTHSPHNVNPNRPKKPRED